MIENGTIRKDGKRWDGSVWRKVGINHHMNEDGLIYYKRKYRTLNGYIQQGGNINRLVFNSVKPKDIAVLAKALYDRDKEGYVYAITNPAWPEWIKIGKAMDSDDRLDRFQTGDPMREYKGLCCAKFEDRNVAERKAHKLAETKGERRYEWFKITEEQAVEILQEIA